MVAVPTHVIDTLNGLLEGHLGSVLECLLKSSAYLKDAPEGLGQLLEETLQTCKKQRRELIELIESLGGIPRAKTRATADEQYLSLLSLKFLLPTLVNEKDLLLRRYENARASIGDEYPQVIETLLRLEAEQCVYIEKLKEMAEKVTAGKYEPPPHSNRCREEPGAGEAE